MNDKEIREAIDSGRLVIDPFDPSLIQPNSLDVRLGGTESRYVTTGYNNIINLANDAPRNVSRQVDEVLIRPGEFVLVETLEYIEMPNDMYGMVIGKSSSGRLGIDTENAGLIDSGFKGTITLELYNKQRTISYRIPVGFEIAQIAFFECNEVETPYGSSTTSRYQGQRGATAYRVKQNDTAHQGTADKTDGETSTFGKAIDIFSARKRRKRSA